MPAFPPCCFDLTNLPTCIGTYSYNIGIVYSILFAAEIGTGKELSAAIRGITVFVHPNYYILPPGRNRLNKLALFPYKY